MNPAYETSPVCPRCAHPLGEQFVVAHRTHGTGPAETIAIHHDCATSEERRASAERKSKGTGW